MNITYLELDLQLFATQTTLLGSYNAGQTTDAVNPENGTPMWNGSGLSAEMKTFYDMTLIDEAKPNLVHAQFGQKKPIPKGGGKSIEFRKFAPLAKALTPLTEGVTPDGGSLNVSGLTAYIKQYGYFIEVSDMLELTAIDNILVETTKLIGAQAGLSMDTVVRDALHQGLNANFAHRFSGSTEYEVLTRKGLDDTAQLTVDEVNQVVAKLRANNAPTINGKYVAIIHPYVAYDLMRDPAWIDSHKYAKPDNLYAGEIGEIGGVRFVQTSEAKIYAPAPIYGFRKLTNSETISSSTRSVVINEDLGLDAAPTIATPIPCYVGGSETPNTITAISKSDTTYTLTLGTAISSLAPNAVITGIGGTKDGLSVFSTLFMGANAFGDTEITGGGLQTIIKQKGSAGTADPLEQRATVGWKGTKAVEILVERYMVRLESCSKRFSATAEEN